MRFLKFLAIFMVALVLVSLGLVGYFYATARVSIAAYSAAGVSATECADDFARLKTQIADNTFEGTLFKTGELGNAEDYAFITYTLRLSNQCLIPVDMIEVQIEPDGSDVLQIADHEVHSLQSKSQGDITATILTAKDSHSIRQIIVTYYVWGVSFSITETYGG